MFTAFWPFTSLQTHWKHPFPGRTCIASDEVQKLRIQLDCKSSHCICSVVSQKASFEKSTKQNRWGVSGQEKGVVIPKILSFMVALGNCSTTERGFQQKLCYFSHREPECHPLGMTSHNEIRDTSMSPRKQDRGGVQSRSKAGSKETEKLSSLGYALEALVSETNFSIDKLILGGRPAEFLDQKSKKGLVKKRSLLNKNCIKKLIFPYRTASIRQSRINKGIQNLEWIRETLDIMPI